MATSELSEFLQPLSRKQYSGVHGIRNIRWNSIECRCNNHLLQSDLSVSKQYVPTSCFWTERTDAKHYEWAEYMLSAEPDLQGKLIPLQEVNTQACRRPSKDIGLSWSI